MFEASYLNYVEVKCFDHPRLNITHVCTDYKCSSKPFMCSDCLASHSHRQKHYGHDLQIKELMPTADYISKSLQKNRKPIEEIYKKVSQEKQNQSLLKYQEEKEQHCQSIRKHIESIKFEIEEEMKNIVKVFEQQLQKQKQNMYRELQKYYENYRDKFEQFSKKMGPISAISKSYKYFSSKHNLLLKMMTDSQPDSLNRWFNELKKSVKAAQILSADPEKEYEKVKKLSISTNELMDQLPRIRNTEYEEELPKLMSCFLQEVFKLMIKFGEEKIQPDFSRGNSINGYQNFF